MENINPAELLGYGAIGLGFMLAVLTYRLLSSEQSRDSEPRKKMLTSIYVFMSFSMTLTALGFVSEYLDKGRTAAPEAQLTPTLGPVSPKNISQNNLEELLVGLNIVWPAKKAYSGATYQHFDVQGINVAAEFIDPSTKSSIGGCSNDTEFLLIGKLSKSPTGVYILITDAELRTSKGLTIQCI